MRQVGCYPYLRKTGGILSGPVTFGVSGAAKPHLAAGSGYGPLVLGKLGTATYATLTDDVLIPGKSEHLGEAWFAGEIRTADRLRIGGYSYPLYIDVNGAGASYHGVMGLPPQNLLVLAKAAHMSLNHGFGLITYPTLAGFSDRHPVTYPNEYWAVYHKQTASVLKSAVGPFILGEDGTPWHATNQGDVFVTQNLAVGDSLGVNEITTDTNTDCFINPNGTGKVKFGTYTADATVENAGYVTTKDSAGNTILLCAVEIPLS